MMKRIVLSFAIAVVAGGMVWAQPTPGDGPNVFGSASFNAVPTLSTEARYSAGRFTSDVDNYIDPRFHNPDIGTFLFLGGFPSNDIDVDYTELLGSTTRISFGFGHTLGALYLALYYGGSLVSGSGDRFTDMDPAPDDTEVTRNSQMAWRNNLALLLGIANMGIRFDLIMDTDTARHTLDGYPGPGGTMGSLPSDVTGAGWSRTYAPALALTWGSRFGNLAPYVTIGYRFHDQYVWGGTIRRYDEETGDLIREEELEYRFRRNAALGVFAGAEFALSDTANVGGELRFGTAFAANDRFTWESDTDYVTSAGGAWAVGLHAYFAQTFDAGVVAVGLRPWIDAEFSSESRNTSLTEDDFMLSPFNFFALGTGFDLGIRFMPTARFAFFTGAGLQLIEWNHVSRSDSNREPNRVSAWTIDGISWDSRRTAGAGNLGFGMTFTNQAENIVVGAGLNAILDRFIRFNVEEMRIDTGGSGSWWNEDRNNSLSQVGAIFSDIRFDLTVSARLGGGNGNGNGRRAVAPPAPAPTPAPVSYVNDNGGDIDNGDDNGDDE